MVFSRYSEYYSEIDSLYHADIVIKDATAEILVNDKDKYVLRYDSGKKYDYTCDYKPQIGDKIAINVKAPGFKDVYATSWVEKSQNVDISNTEVVYKERDENDDKNSFYGPIEVYGVDSVMRITLKIKDDPAVHNYYRLVIRGVADQKEEILPGIYHEYYSVSDLFTSDDIIFMDSQLTKPFGAWKAGMTNVFDDHLFNGQEYTFTVDSRKRNGDNPRVIVELQSISQDLYYFLKSYMLFRISTDDVYTTPVGIYSNIDNGWGIFGTLSYDAHTIYY